MKKTHCLRGHERTPENVDSTGYCKECKRKAAVKATLAWRQRNLSKYLEYQRVYNQSEAGKERNSQSRKRQRQRGYYYTPERREYSRIYTREWRRQPERLLQNAEYQRRFHQERPEYRHNLYLTPEFREQNRERMREYRQTPKWQEYAKQYRARPEVKERINERQRSAKYREYQREYRQKNLERLQEYDRNWKREDYWRKKNERLEITNA